MGQQSRGPVPLHRRGPLSGILEAPFEQLCASGTSCRMTHTIVTILIVCPHS